MTIWVPEIDRDSGPLYQTIARAIAADLGAGRLRPGDQLPPQRELADALGVTLGTITRAYSEARRRGLVSGEVGRGTFVTGDSVEHRPLLMPGVVESDRIEMGMSLPLSSNDPDLAPVLEELSKDRRLGELLRYQPPAGAPRHRAVGAEWIRRAGLEVSPDDVVVCAGAQQAMTVLFLALAAPGETVMTEGLTYPGMKSLAALLRLRLEPVAIDDEGVIPEALDEVSRRSGARLLYCIPTLHNPTTRTMSRARREALAQIVGRRELKVVEDDVHGLLLEEPLAPISSLARERCYYISSVSKVLAGGLRVAFVATPPGQRERVAAAVASTSWMTTPLSVEVAARWIESGQAAQVVAARRTEAQARQELARAALEGQRFESAPSSYHLWLELPEPWRSEDFAAAAIGRGVGVAASSLFSVGRAGAPPFVRISLTAVVERKQLAEGLAVIADLLREGPTPGPAVV